MSHIKAEPKGIRINCGAKVHWRTYATAEEANHASSIAKHNARILEQQGYDSGFQVPGHITAVEDGWEVCFL